MILGFIFHLNLASLLPKKRQEVIEKTSLIYTKSIQNFEYKKNINKY